MTTNQEKEKLEEVVGQYLADLTADQAKVLRVRFGLEPAMAPDKEEERLRELASYLSKLQKK
jgi:DNA-directed RNA polymerase sigma subunit (sigma70/sigma32)